MDVVDLVLTVCLAANAADCREEHLYFESRGDLRQCMFLAQPEIAKWSGQHPHLKVVRWECKYPDKAKGA
jgi:hypothetical protein